MKTEVLQDIVFEHLIGAQIALERDGFLTPLIIIVNDMDEVRLQPVVIETDEDIETLNELLHKFSEISQSLVLIVNAYQLTISNEDTRPVDLTEHPDARQYIHCFLYTKEETIIRRMPYTDTDGRYLFHDLGWETIVEHYAEYKNPFFK